MKKQVEIFYSAMTILRSAFAGARAGMREARVDQERLKQARPAHVTPLGKHTFARRNG